MSLKVCHRIIIEHGVSPDSIESFKLYTETTHKKKKVILQMKDGTAQVLGEDGTNSAP